MKRSLPVIPEGTEVLIQFEGGEFEKASVNILATCRYLIFDSSGFLKRRSDTLPNKCKIWDPSRDIFPGKNCAVYYPRLSFLTDDRQLVYEEECYKWEFADSEKRAKREMYAYMYQLLEMARSKKQRKGKK